MRKKGFLFLKVWWLVSCVSVKAITIYVSTTGSDTAGDGSLNNPYQTIQKGVNACPVGGTVAVSAGTYNEAIYINKRIALIGAGADVTVIDATGQGNTNTVTFDSTTANNAIISGFRITGATGCRGLLIKQEYIAIMLHRLLPTI